MKRGICILETGLMENEMGKEHCSLARETGIQGNGRMIKWMDKENYSQVVELFLKVLLLTIWNMD